MTLPADIRGATPIRQIADLSEIEAAAVLYLRLWFDGEDSQARVWNDFATLLGPERGRAALRTCEQLFGLCAAHARRPLMRHSVMCACVGSDEACFCNFIATALEGDREDALLIATLLVRADHAPALTALGLDYALALRHMVLRRPKSDSSPVQRSRLH